jgi:hypothetical protein
VPHAFKLDKELGKSGLVIVMVESQMGDASKADVVGFLMQKFPKDFPNSDVFVTVGENGPFPSGSSGLPHCAVIGADGRLAVIGNPGALGGKLDDAIQEELKKVQTGWGKSPEVKKARALMYGKKKLGEAAAALAAAESKIKEDAREDFAEAKAELDAKYASLKSAVAALMAEGRFADAKAAATEFQKAVKGKAEWEGEATTLVAEFAKPEVDKELKLEKTLAGILKSIGDKKPTEEHAKKLGEFAKKNDGSKVAARATMFASAAAWKDSSSGGAAAKKDEPPKKDEGSPPKGE